MSMIGDSLQLATQAHESGDWVQAAKLYDKLLAQEPANFRVLHQFGRLCHQVGRHRAAQQLLRQAIDLAVEPQSSARCHADLAAVFLAEDRITEALAICELARDQIHADATGPDLLLMQADAFRQLGQNDQSLAVLLEASAQFPEDERCCLELAKMYQTVGNVEAAAVELERVLELNPKQAEAVLLLTYLMIDGEVAIGIPWIDRIRVILPYVSDHGLRIRLRFALGDVHRHRSEPDQAMAAFRHANQDQIQQLSLHGGVIRLEQLTVLVDELIKFFQSDTIERFQQLHGDKTTQPTFVVGMPGAGQEDWARESNPSAHVVTWPDGPLLDTMVDNLVGSHSRYPHDLPTVPPEHWRRARDEYLASIRRIGPLATQVINPRPSNILYVGLIRILFPNARVVHCARDRDETVMECFRQPRPLDRIAATDLRTLEQIHDQFDRLATHWKAVARIEWVTM